MQYITQYEQRKGSVELLDMGRWCGANELFRPEGRREGTALGWGKGGVDGGGHMRSLRPKVAQSGTKQRSLELVVGCDWSPQFRFPNFSTCQRSFVRDNETNIFYDHYEDL